MIITEVGEWVDCEGSEEELLELIKILFEE
jgi:hypothetical protein